MPGVVGSISHAWCQTGPVRTAHGGHERHRVPPSNASSTRRTSRKLAARTAAAEPAAAERARPSTGASNASNNRPAGRSSRSATASPAGRDSVETRGRGTGSRTGRRPARRRPRWPPRRTSPGRSRRQPGCRQPPCCGDHRRRAVDARVAAARQPFEHERGRDPVPAPDLDDVTVVCRARVGRRRPRASTSTGRVLVQAGEASLVGGASRPR